MKVWAIRKKATDGNGYVYFEGFQSEGNRTRTAWYSSRIRFGTESEVKESYDDLITSKGFDISTVEMFSFEL